MKYKAICHDNIFKQKCWPTLIAIYAIRPSQNCASNIFSTSIATMELTS